jgi:hypothetical protein
VLNHDEILRWLVNQKNQAKTARDEREVEVQKRLEIYQATPEYYDEKFPALPSHVTDASVAQAIDRRMASFARIFFGGRSVGKITGARPEFDPSAQKMDALIQYQLEHQNNFFSKGSQWLKDKDIQLVGIVKVTWDEEREEVEETIPMDIETMNQAELAGTLRHAEISGDFDLLGRPMFLASVKYDRIVDAKPVIENVPSDEILYTPNARSLKEAPFVAQVIKRSISDLMESGRYDKKELKALQDAGAPPDETRTELDRRETNQDDPDKDKKKEVYDCYFRYDINNDGIDEHLTAVICGDRFIKKPEINEEEDHPFCLLGENDDPHRVWPRLGMIDRAGEIQHQLVATLRQLQVSLSLSNNPQAIVDRMKFEDITQLIEGNSVVGSNGPPQNSIQWRPVPNIATWTMQYIEMLRGQIELITGVTRYNQGTDGESLNKTATGISMIISQGSQAIEYQARKYAETGFKRLIERLIALNCKYLPDGVYKSSIGMIEITQQDKDAQFEYQTDVGIGAGAREQSIQLLQQLKAEAPILVQTGLMDMMGVYNLVKKSYEEMGLTNVADYLINPTERMQNGPIGPAGQPGGVVPGMPGLPPPGGVSVDAGGLPQGNGIMPQGQSIPNSGFMPSNQVA